MPQVARQTLKMDCAGVDLIRPFDEMPEGHFPYLNNVRVVQEGRLESRPGYTTFNLVALSNKALHSIRRLNDAAKVFAAAGYIYVVGAGTTLWAGTENALSQIDTGYSGNPLSIITFRPENSPEAFAYVYDANKMTKVRPDGTIRPIGVVPPLNPALTEADYGPPAIVELDDGQATTGWTITAGSSISVINSVDRQGAGGANDGTIGSILYNSGTSGWCCIVPSNPTNSNWAGDRMLVDLNHGGGNEEHVLVREIHPAIVATTISGIQYDSGSTGICSIVLANSPTGLARNSLISINNGVNTDLVRVLAVIPSPDGTTYSIRASTTHTMAAGNTVTGNISWYTYTINTHAAAETLTSLSVYARGTSFGGASAVSSIAKLVAKDASKANGRAIDIANDWMHMSFWSTVGQGITQVRIYIDVDANTTSLANAFQNNYFFWTLTSAQLFGAGAAPTGGFWNELLIPISQATRVGSDPTRTLANIQALKIEWTQTKAGDVAFDWWYLWGTYGPVIQPNSPTGYLYETRYRDSTTGAASVPGPPTRYSLNPLREEVLVTPKTTAVASVDSDDVYRQGGTLSNFTFDGTVTNNNGSPNTFHDDFSDNSIGANAVVDLTLLQPWSIVDNVWSGTVNVVGTSVIWASGTTFNTACVAGTVILINGIAYQMYGSPVSTTFLEITADGGVQTGVPFVVASPILAGQSLPFAFGPLEGPFAPVVFALGDPKNPGTLYFTNAANLDGASDLNTLEVAPPSEPLISGATWNGLVFVGSRDNIYLVRYTYLTSVSSSGPGTFQFQRLQSPSGIWARWACCRGQDGVYFLGRDGIYRANESGVVSVTDFALYPLWPHDGQPAPNSTNGVAAPDMTQLAALRLSAADNDIYFDYIPLGASGAASGGSTGGAGGGGIIFDVGNFEIYVSAGFTSVF